MRLTKIRDLIKEQVLLLEKAKWYRSMKAANDACVDCPECCQVSAYQTNFFGIIKAVKMSCVGCPESVAPGTILMPNGQPHGVISKTPRKPEGDPFNPEPQMRASDDIPPNAACPCPNGDMDPSCCPKSSGMMSLDKGEISELYGTLYEDITLLNEGWITSGNPIRLQNFCTDCIDGGKCCFTDSSKNTTFSQTVGCFSCQENIGPGWIPVLPYEAEGMEQGFTSGIGDDHFDPNDPDGQHRSMRRSDDIPPNAACPCPNGDMDPSCCPKSSGRTLARDFDMREMIDDLEGKVITEKPNTGGCGCSK